MRDLIDITPQEVTAAYRRNGLRPAAGHVEVNGDCCCAIGALVIDGGGDINAEDGYEMLLASVGIVAGKTGPRWAAGFDAGLDGSELPSGKSEAFRAGYMVGLACCSLVNK